MLLLMETASPTTTPHRRERAVNRRVQGDIGELSAMEWLASKNAVVWVPFTHSPHVDLMAEFEDRLVRVQVKTSTYRARHAVRRSGLLPGLGQYNPPSHPGGVPERSNGSDCKSDGYAYAGSNPASPISEPPGAVAPETPSDLPQGSV
jgi:hypothetical protein